MDVDVDYATEFIGEYYTDTDFESYKTNQTWEVTRLDKNLLAIDYKILTTIKIPRKIEITEMIPLRNVQVLKSGNIKIDETVDLARDGQPVRVHVQGIGTMSLNANNVMVVGTSFKITELDSNVENETEFLEFKKK
jgi:hypothetical protein